MKKLKAYLDTKKKKTPLAEKLEKYKKERDKVIDKAIDKPKDVEKKDQGSDLTQLSEKLKQEIIEEITVRQQEFVTQLRIEVQEDFKKELTAILEVLDLEAENENSEKDKEEIPQPKQTNEPVASNNQEKTYEVDKKFFDIARTLRVPKENHETLLYALKGKGLLSDVQDDEQLAKVIKETVTQMPLFQRSTQYKTKAANTNDSTPKPERRNERLAERKQRLAAQLKTMSI
jgi:hypothetical protein